MPESRWGGRLAGRAAGANPYDLATIVLLFVLTILVFATFRDYGVSNDETVQHRYGELIIRYYRSGFTDESLFTFENLYLYGGLFDVVAVLTSGVLPFEAHHIRHVLCALIGVGGIAATAMTARLVAGPRAGALAAALLTVFGLWYGGMFNHTKDIPFATGMIAATYGLLRAMRDFPRPQARHVILFGLFLGMALGQRATGLLMLCYLALAPLLTMPGAGLHTARQRIRYWCETLIAFAPGLLLAYLIMIAAWPWASLQPLNPVRALFAFARFHYEIPTIFAGQVYHMDTVPPWYVPAYVAIKLPLLTLVGAALAMAIAALSPRAGRAGLGMRQRTDVALLAFAVLFPLACEAIASGPAFSGMRHFLFVAPPLTVLGAIGIDASWRLLQSWRRPAAGALAAVIAIWLAWNAVTLARLHPYQYLDYNTLVGGLPGAARGYVMDYWVNVLPEALNELQAYLDRPAPDSPWPKKQRYDVAVCGEKPQFEAVKYPDMQWAADWDRADFYVAPTHMGCETLMQGPMIARISRMGVAIGVVKDIREHRRAVAAARGSQ